MQVADLSEAPWNPRAIDEASLTALGASQRAFGDISGIVFNRRLGLLVCGHQRLRRLRDDHGGCPAARRARRRTGDPHTDRSEPHSTR